MRLCTPLLCGLAIPDCGQRIILRHTWAEGVQVAKVVLCFGIASGSLLLERGEALGRWDRVDIQRSLSGNCRGRRRGRCRNRRYGRGSTLRVCTVRKLRLRAPLT